MKNLCTHMTLSNSRNIVILALGTLFLTSGCSLLGINQKPNLLGTWEIDWSEYPGIFDKNPQLKEELSGLQVIVSQDNKVFMPTAGFNKGRYIEINLKKISDDYSPPRSTDIVDYATYFDEQVQGSTTKALEASAKSQLGAINRAQQAFRLENPRFATSFGSLGTGSLEADSYRIRIEYADREIAYVTATAHEPNLKSFSGVVTADRDGTTTARICDTSGPSQVPPPRNCK